MSRQIMTAHLPTIAFPPLRHLPSYLLQCLLALLPRWMRRDPDLCSKKLKPTSYLDGLRGVAALIVMNAHRSPWDGHWFFNMPIINMLRNGKSMVMIFFVISGFVLSTRLLRLARSQQYAQFSEALASATFRRYPRLFIPIFSVTFLSMAMINFGWIQMHGATAAMPSFFAQFQDWLSDCTRIGNPFFVKGWFEVPGERVANSHYIIILWTIPVEYCGSMAVYAFCAASCRMPSCKRMMFCALLSVLCYVFTALYAAVFLAGAFLAEISLIRESKKLSEESISLVPYDDGEPRIEEEYPSEKAQRDSGLGPLHKALYTAIFIIAIFLLSWNNVPRGAWRYPPWPFLNSIIPTHIRATPIWLYYYPSMGAILLVFALDSYPTLRSPLEWKFTQYLGEISFGIYVTHFIIFGGVDDQFVRPFIQAWFGSGPWAQVPSWALNFPLVLWMAELFTKYDVKVVRFGRWLEGRMFGA